MNALVSNVLTQVFITLIAVSGIYVLTGLIVFVKINLWSVATRAGAIVRDVAA